VAVVMEVVNLLSIDRPPSRWVSWGSLVWPLDPSGDDESGHSLRDLPPADLAKLDHSPKAVQNLAGRVLRHPAGYS